MSDPLPESEDPEEFAASSPARKVRYRARRGPERKVPRSIKLRESVAQIIDELAAESHLSRNAYIEDVLTVAAMRRWVRRPAKVEEPRFEEGGRGSEQ